MSGTLTVEILRKEAPRRGWQLWWGAVNGRRLGVRLPLTYTDDIPRAALEEEVRDALKTEYYRLTKAEGGAVPE